MLKMIFHTLVVLLLVMLIAGRESEDLKQAQAETGVSRAEVGLPTLFDASKITTQSDPVLVSASEAPVITPVRHAPMPGPALRPSPEYRTKDAAPVLAGGALYVIDTNRANIRSGPSTTNPVVERLSRGEEVLVISDASAAWVQIRIEGDGIEGWVARSLLRPAR
ncbi:MAG: SH3 domain-containing protein [Sphingomonadales bacterium]|nr:SH3 domain-containing protein [Sphingomonadales bacterium]